MILADLEQYDNVVIQLHDSPDADAVGSGYAMYRYFTEKGKAVRIVYGGRNVITKSNMKLLTAALDMNIEYVGDKDENGLGNPELLMTVDCQYGQGNVQYFKAQNVAVIDHHNTGQQFDEMKEIRSNIASCCTVCYALLKKAGVDVNKDIKLCTALYYGLYMDSNRLSEISHPLDRDMVDFLRYDKNIINRLTHANFSMAELETVGAAISNNIYIEKYGMAIAKSTSCDPNMLGVVGDLVIQVDSIDVCVIFNECFGGYKISVRSCTPEIAANELVTFITADTGNGGGHIDKAGGFINGDMLNKVSGDMALEDYITKRMEEFCAGFDVVHYNREVSKPELLRPYRKKPGIQGFVKLMDVFAPGTECKIRTLEGDVFVECRADIYLMIGSIGEVYPIEKDVFKKKYHATEVPYYKDYEYEPSVINTMESRSYGLMPYARQCYSDGGSVVLARQLDRYTKVFSKWDYEVGMIGRAGDMLCYAKDDSQEVYIVKRDVFADVYEDA